MSDKLTQTELGQFLGLSSIAMGKKLVELGLRDPDTKLATPFAIQRKIAKTVKYLRGGEEVRMSVYNHKTLQYIKNKLGANEFVAQELLGKLKGFQAARAADDGSKGGYLMWELASSEFGHVFKTIENNAPALQLFLELLKKEKLTSFFEATEWGQDLKKKQQHPNE